MPKLASRFELNAIDSTHRDFGELSRLRDAILSHSNGKERLAARFPSLLQDAIDFVLDPVHTARRAVSELDNVEKTFIGLKVEHFLRDFLDVPKGLRDLRIDGTDVDIKNTVGGTWMIPPETYRNQEPCLLIAIADEDKQCWLGIMLARGEYLGSESGNRDKKRQVTRVGQRNILWIIAGAALPASRWVGIDMLQFRQLRSEKGGTKRATEFFRSNLGKTIHRTIVQALLFDQRDYMKRLRGNGGARDMLRKEGVQLLSGAYDSKKISALGLGPISKEEFVAVRLPEPQN